MDIKTEKEDLIYELNRANKLAEEATLNYMNMCKQVEKLEQENEELKKSVRQNKEKRKNATEKYQALKDYTNKQNFELVLENEGLQSLNDFNVQKIETLEAENEELKEDNHDLDVDLYVEKEARKADLEMLDKYKQCLDEIEDLLTTCENNNCKGCKYTKQCSEIDTHGWILQKIEEAKNND